MMKINTPSKISSKGMAAFLGGTAALLLTASGSHAAPTADGMTWRAIDTGSTGNFISVSAVGDYAVASTSGNQIFEYRNNEWTALTSWNTYVAENSPFGTTAPVGDRNQIRVAAVSENEFFIVSYASQGNYARYRNGTYSTYSSGTGLRSMAITSFSAGEGIGGLLVGRGNGGFSRLAITESSGSVYHTRTTAPGTSAGSLSRATASSYQNMWLSNGTQLFRSTNGGAGGTGSSGMTWIEQARPASITGSVGAMGAWEVDTGSGMAYYNFLGVTNTSAATTSLYLWDNVNGYNETALFTLTGEDSFTVTGLYVQDDENIWIAGSGGNLWYYDGDTASKIDLGITTTLNAISGSGGSIWVAGASGQVFTTAAAIPEPGVMALAGIAGAAMIGYSRRKRQVQG